MKEKNYKLIKQVTGAGDRWGDGNYKLQNTNYKQITNYKLQITKGETPVVFVLLGIPNNNARNHKKGNGVFEVDQVLNQLIIKSMNHKGSHGLHQGSFKLQTMTALIKSFCGGSRGAVFSKRVPLAAGGKE